MEVRKASHAGEWYSRVPEELSAELHRWLEEAAASHAPARAIIAPHAGYQFSGPCAAYAYKQIDPFLVKRVFILGPSHHKAFTSCALTKAQKYETPLYDLQVDAQVNRDLQSTGEFEVMDLEVDENEHSIEMHLPYVAKVMESSANKFTIVPILVGTLLSVEHEERFGRIFAKYLADPQNLFVVSSDFCHWGRRFRYTPYDADSFKSISEFIEALDRTGMNLIENLDPVGFRSYLEKHGNTICGRVPIIILLNAISAMLRGSSDGTPRLKFVRYAQSNQCRSLKDSSVSYASGSLIIE